MRKNSKESHACLYSDHSTYGSALAYNVHYKLHFLFEKGYSKMQEKRK